MFEGFKVEIFADEPSPSIFVFRTKERWPPTRLLMKRKLLADLNDISEIFYYGTETTESCLSKYSVQVDQVTVLLE